MTSALLLLALALPASARDLGGHVRPAPLIDQPAPADERRATLEEMWLRGLLPPDQSAWSPADAELLARIQGVESDALTYLKRRFGTYRPWVARTKTFGRVGPWRLTKAGYEKYWALLSQDAIAYFEKKGADAKWTFKLKTLEGRPLFDAKGLLTDEGARVHRRGVLNMEVFWKGPDGQTFGTRRPPTKNP